MNPFIENSSNSDKIRPRNKINKVIRRKAKAQRSFGRIELKALPPVNHSMGTKVIVPLRMPSGQTTASDFSPRLATPIKVFNLSVSTKTEAAQPETTPAPSRAGKLVLALW
jgi:hypothetical protein